MWFKAWLMRVFSIPMQVVIHRVDIAGDEDISGYTPEHFKAWASIYGLVPGLYAVHMAAMREVMTKLGALSASDDSHGERIRLVQRACDCWQNLQFAAESAKQLSAVLAKKSDGQSQSAGFSAGNII